MYMEVKNGNQTAANETAGVGCKIPRVTSYDTTTVDDVTDMMSEDILIENDDDDENEIAGIDDDDIAAALGGEEEEESRFCDPPPGSVRLRPSQFQNIPATIFVEYPPELGVKRDDISVLEPLGVRKLGYKSHWERVCIKNAHHRAGFNKSEKYWTSLWSKHQNESQMKELNCLQKLNHFPGSWCIGRKDRLTRTLNTMKRAVGHAFYDYHPETFILPGERDAVGRAIRSEQAAASNKHSASTSTSTSTSGSGKGLGGSAGIAAQGGLWIIKPPSSSCGQGIKVLNGQQILAMPKRKKVLVQRYLHKPYLIDGKKFDLRIYVLVAGVDPLRVYIHDEGLTRISTAKYSLKNTSDRFAHLTNYSINKKAANFKAASFSTASSSSSADGAAGGATAGGEERAEKNASDPEMEGFKWSLAAFRRWLAKKEGQRVMERTFDKIFDLCLKTVIAAESHITPHLHSIAQYRTSCFELFGMDVILDNKLEPQLLEVNVSPSLMGSSPLDKKIKGLLIADTLHIMGMYPHDPALLKKFNYMGTTTSSNIHSSGSGGVGGGTSSKKHTASNPFAFGSLSKLMQSQDGYRRNPCAESVDIAALGDTDSSWLLLLLAEDELVRSKSSRYHLVHPTPRNAPHYTQLYRSCRFSDHLLAHWVMHGGSTGRYRNLVPARYRRLSTTSTTTTTTTGKNKPNNNPSNSSSSSSRHAAAATSSATGTPGSTTNNLNVGVKPPSTGSLNALTTTAFHTGSDDTTVSSDSVNSTSGYGVNGMRMEASSSRAQVMRARSAGFERVYSINNNNSSSTSTSISGSGSGSGSGSIPGSGSLAAPSSSALLLYGNRSRSASRARTPAAALVAPASFSGPLFPPTPAPAAGSGSENTSNNSNRSSNSGGSGSSSSTRARVVGGNDGDMATPVGSTTTTTTGRFSVKSMRDGSLLSVRTNSSVVDRGSTNNTNTTINSKTNTNSSNPTTSNMYPGPLPPSQPPQQQQPGHPQQQLTGWLSPRRAAAETGRGLFIIRPASAVAAEGVGRQCFEDTSAPLEHLIACATPPREKEDTSSSSSTSNSNSSSSSNTRPLSSVRRRLQRGISDAAAYDDDSSRNSGSKTNRSSVVAAHDNHNHSNNSIDTSSSDGQQQQQRLFQISTTTQQPREQQTQLPVRRATSNNDVCQAATTAATKEREREREPVVVSKPLSVARLQHYDARALGPTSTTGSMQQQQQSQQPHQYLSMLQMDLLDSAITATTASSSTTTATGGGSEGVASSKVPMPIDVVQTAIAATATATNKASPHNHHHHRLLLHHHQQQSQSHSRSQSPLSRSNTSSPVPAILASLNDNSPTTAAKVSSAAASSTAAPVSASVFTPLSSPTSRTSTSTPIPAVMAAMTSSSSRGMLLSSTTAGTTTTTSTAATEAERELQKVREGIIRVLDSTSNRSNSFHHDNTSGAAAAAAAAVSGRFMANSQPLQSHLQQQQYQPTMMKPPLGVESSSGSIDGHLANRGQKSTTTPTTSAATSASAAAAVTGGNRVIPFPSSAMLPLPHKPIASQFIYNPNNNTTTTTTKSYNNNIINSSGR